MTKIIPLSHHVLLRFAPKNKVILQPKGNRPLGDIIVEDMGPDVPPSLFQVGDKILLRGDAKVFGTDQEGGNETTGIVPFQMIMAIVTDDQNDNTLPLPFEQEVSQAIDSAPLPTDDEIDKLIEAHK